VNVETTKVVVTLVDTFALPTNQGGVELREKERSERVREESTSIRV
jgi:hypothetical protein